MRTFFVFIDKFQGLIQMKDATTAQSAKFVKMKFIYKEKVYF